MHAALAYQALGIKTQKDNLFNPENREGAHNERTPRPAAIGV